MKQVRRILFSLLGFSILFLPTTGKAEVTSSNKTNIHWAYIIDQGDADKRITLKRASNKTITAKKVSDGQYVVTFPKDVKNIGCTATVNSGTGYITCVPGDNAGLLSNQVSVIQWYAGNGGYSSNHFTVTVYY